MFEFAEQVVWNNSVLTGRPIMIVVTTESLPGYSVTKVLGFVDGAAICFAKSTTSRKILFFTTQTIDPAEVANSHQAGIPDAINDAIEDMIRRAEEMGADAIIGLQTSSIRGAEFHTQRDTFGAKLTQPVITMYVCGTAVRAQKTSRPANP